MKSIQTMLVFDIDGVLTNPRTMVLNETSLNRIAQELHQGIPVALNTGRSTEWVFERLIPSLTEKISSSDMAHLLLVAEKGGVRVVFGSAEPEVVIDESIALPQAFMQAAPALLDDAADEATRLKEYMFWDAGKRTMASFEKHQEVAIEEFDRVRGKLYTGIEQLLEQHNLQEFHIDESTISTDVEHQRAGKHKGAEQVLEWLAKRGEQVEEFYSFGDSPSDETMAVAFASKAKSTFIYVGMKPLGNNDNAKHTRLVMNGRFDADTASYLEKL
jgi:hydroxymethylpyrimidine pyrophosphatase-like HAD family hydrolase